MSIGQREVVARIVVALNAWAAEMHGVGNYSMGIALRNAAASVEGANWQNAAMPPEIGPAGVEVMVMRAALNQIATLHERNPTYLEYAKNDRAFAGLLALVTAMAQNAINDADQKRP